MRKNLITLPLLLITVLLFASPIHISIRDTELTAFTEDFYGLQYHKIAFKDSVATNKLEKLDIKWIRQWAYPEQFHPEPGVWDWSELDDKINTATGLGYEIALCLFQSHDWFAGTPDSGWWYVDSARTEWAITARELAIRYKDDVKIFLLFDEVNYMFPEQDDYMTFKTCAELYIEAASEIKAVDPTLLCGGPSGHSGWENGHWGTYVMNEPGADTLLDLIAANQFITWGDDESDDDVMNHTIWYEEGPTRIKEKMGADLPDMLILDAYNVNGSWNLNGELWTDPRNTNIFGGIYHAAAKLHAAKGGYDIALHWDALGGYGVLQWYPDYNENVPYYSWRYLIETADITPGSILIYATTSETPKTNILHMSNEQTDCFTVQPFAVKTVDDRIRLILINKHADTKDVLIDTPPGMNHYKLFRFDEDRIEIANDMISCDGLEDSLLVTCPGMSVTVIQYGPELPVNISDIALPNDTRIIGNYPNPFNPATAITYRLSADSFVELSVLDVNGRRITTLLSENRKQGVHSIQFKAEHLSTGTYFLRMTAGQDVDVKKILFVK
jgi:Secretion system C-terminal sorting domain